MQIYGVMSSRLSGIVDVVYRRDTDLTAAENRRRSTEVYET